MIAENISTCPKCGGRLRYFDTVKRNSKEEEGNYVY